MEKYDVVGWLKNGIELPVFDQQRCGCCSVAAALMCCTAILAMEEAKSSGRIPTPVELAVQEIINYIHLRYPGECEAKNCEGCPGVHPETVFKYIKKHGVCRAEDMEFEGRMSDTPVPEGKPRFTIEDYIVMKDPKAPDPKCKDHLSTPKFPPIDRGEILRTIQKHPIVGIADVFDSFEEFNGEDIYKGPTDENDQKTKYEHALLVVDYGTSPKGVQYYVCQNSWGEPWGLKGLGRVPRDMFNAFSWPVKPKDQQRPVNGINWGAN